AVDRILRRGVADVARCVVVPKPEADLGRVFLEGEAPVPEVTVPMSGAATLEEPVADEAGVRERRYVLAMIRARWGLLAFGVTLLAVVRLLGLVPIPWLLIAGFGVGCAGLNYATS